MTSSPSPAVASRRKLRGLWLKQLHQWHWISSAVSLFGLLLFAVTGFTLNHAGEIEGAPVTTTADLTLPAPLAAAVRPDAAPDGSRPLPAPVADWLGERLSRAATGDAEWSEDEVYLALPRPGGDGWVSIDRATGAVSTEQTDRGWIAWANDLHKGRNTGTAWSWFIDIFAAASLLFALTGLLLLHMHAHRRPSTWPLVALGLVIPALIAFAIH